MFWKKEKTKKQNGIIKLTENGLQVSHSNGIRIVELLSIDRIVAYKLDLLTIDETCLEIDYLEKRLLITEEYTGWRIFLSELINRIPTIEAKWEEKNS